MPASARRSVYLIDRYWLPRSLLMDEAAAVWPAFVDRLFQRIQDEAGVGCPADPPAHDIAGVDVDHEGHVDEAGPGRDVSEVSDPQLVRRRRVELTVHL